MYQLLYLFYCIFVYAMFALILACVVLCVAGSSIDCTNSNGCCKWSRVYDKKGKHIGYYCIECCGWVSPNNVIAGVIGFVCGGCMVCVCMGLCVVVLFVLNAVRKRARHTGDDSAEGDDLDGGVIEIELNTTLSPKHRHPAS